MFLFQKIRSFSFHEPLSSESTLKYRHRISHLNIFLPLLYTPYICLHLDHTIPNLSVTKISLLHFPPGGNTCHCIFLQCKLFPFYHHWLLSSVSRLKSSCSSNRTTHTTPKDSCSETLDWTLLMIMFHLNEQFKFEG